MARRRLTVFSLSFLDVMSCGFGAVVLFFMIINHSTRERSQVVNEDLLAEVRTLEIEVLEGEENLAQVRNSLEQITREEVETSGLSRRIISLLKEKREELAELEKNTLAREEHVNKLKADLQSLEEEARRLEGSTGQDDQGDAMRSFVGQGDRQYLTGLRIGGERILVLVDASASMLDETIVNVIRRRNMSREQKLASRKWQRAVLTADWITAQFPPGAKFQMLTFNTTARPVLEGTDGQWLPTDDGVRLEQAVTALREVEPQDGTSLENVFEAASGLSPAPDNIYLITDGLPTQGRTAPRRGTVSAEDRLRHFERALRALPDRVPVNVILLPMEGDPRAASAFWQLAQASGGSFLSPAQDWP